MKMPTPGDYQEAIQNPQSNIKDDELKVCTPEVTKLGIPFGRTGNFAVTYKMSGDGKKFAVKCFTREAKDLHKRYDLIHKFLRKKKSEYFIDFHYIDNSIFINGEWFPILKMEWLENGELITKYIEKNLYNKEKLNNTLEQLFDLATYLEKEKFSHGDLQAGNILIVNNKMKLIDYDGMYVPDMNFTKSNEIGHENFQHPKRRETHIGDTLDRFSSIVLYLGIKALIYKPELWKKYYDDVDIMIKKNDYENAEDSVIFSEISSIDEMKEEIERFIEICKGKFEDIPHISEFVDKMSEEDIKRIRSKYEKMKNLYFLPADYVINPDKNSELKRFDKIPEKALESLLLLKDYNELLSEYLLPAEILSLGDVNLSDYNTITTFIREYKGEFLKVDRHIQLENDYILPDEMQKDFLQNSSKEEYIEIMRKVEKNKDRLITKKDYFDLKEKYVLPKELLRLDENNSPIQVNQNKSDSIKNIAKPGT